MRHLSVLIPFPATFVLLALLLASSGAQSQTYIFGRSDFPVGNYPVAVAAVDFNGDGLTDLVVTNSGDNTVSVLLGRPNGTFGPQVIYATAPEPVAIVTGDFNGDGNLDLAVANGNCPPGKLGPVCSPSTVSIFLGNGDGTFQPHVDYAVGTLPSSLLAADLNGDGKLDLAVTNAFDGTVSILLGNGDGIFQPQVIYATAGSSAWQSIVVGDFNGDGKPDLAVSCGSVVSVLLGNGDGTFKAHLDSGVGGISLAEGDFNGDGKLDLAETGGGLLSVLLGNGDGTFILKEQYAGGSAVAASDLRRNGILDLIVSGTASVNANIAIAILLGNGDGTFQAATNYGTGSSPFGFTVADLNGDGKLDLALADSGCAIVGNPCTGQQSPPGAISVLLGFGDGTFVGKTDYACGVGPLALTSADFNNDGYLDLATANQLADSVSVLLGNGNGTFQPQVSYPVGDLPLSVATGDFRNNGDLDLVTANEICHNTPPCNPGTLSVLLGNGNGTFQTHVDYGVGLVPYGVAVGDFRGNGMLDLVATNDDSSSVSLLLGNGDGTFQPQVSYLTASYPGQIAIGDFNQDGKRDLAVTTNAGVSILLGNGDGTFKNHVEYPAGGSFGIVSADFNGDGNLDLAVGGEGVVSVLLGNGDGTFKAPVNYPTYVTGVVNVLAVTDFNQDGKLDLAVSTASTESVVLLGNGDGTFQQPIQYLLANLISESLTVGDFNGDGAPDWAAGDADGNTIGVMLSAAFKAVSPGSLNFGSQGVGTTSTAQTITISNPSNVKINIASIASTGNFSQTNNCGVSLSLGVSCQVSVTFTPSMTGLQSGAITVTDSTRISPLAISLSGTGVNGSYLTPYPSRQNFSPQAVGASSAPAAIVLENTGNTSLNLTAISITGMNSSDFGQTNNCGAALAPAGSCTVSVRFTPTAGGSRMASLSVSDTAPGSPQSVALSGTGAAAPDFSITSASGPQTISAGQSANFSLTITPAGGISGTLNLSCAITPVVTPAPTCALSTSSVQLSGTASQPLTVTVGTTAVVTSNATTHLNFPGGWLSLAWAGMLLGLGWPASRKRRLRLAAPLVVLACAALSGCGGSSSHTTTGTPAGKYTATVTGISGSLKHNIPLTVVVQ